jgi:uncharacterized Fe-S cluster-containing radical SAM superfamily protein
MRKDDFMEKELKTQLNRLKYIEAILSGQTPPDFLPRRLFIEVTNLCNYRCIHCPSHTEMTRKRGMMDFELFTSIIDELAEYWPHITINMYKTGEPLLNPRTFDMIDYANERNFFVQINSNLGALKKKDIPRLLHHSYLGISLDAATPETYKTIKNGKEFWSVLDVLLDYLEAWGESAGPDSYPCDVIFLKQPANEAEADLFLEMFSRLPIGHVAVYPMHNFTGYIDEGGQVLRDKKDIPHGEWPRCNVAWDVMGINWDGEAVACIYDVNGRYGLGNVRDRGVLGVWHGPEMERFRQAMLRGDFETIARSGLDCTECSIIWDPGYAIPKDYHSEVARMEQYLTAAVKRVSLAAERHEVVMEKWKYLKANRESWLKELRERGQEVAKTARNTQGV